MYNFLDTSAILRGVLPQTNLPVISPLVLEELEHLKSSKDQRAAYLARQAVRDILGSEYKIIFPMANQHKVDRMLNKYNFLMNINDHRLLCEANLYAQEVGQDINFVTADAALYLFAKKMPHIVAVYYDDNAADNPRNNYCGWGKYYPTDEQFNLLYTTPTLNTLKCLTNEFAELYHDNELKDVLFWDGTQYTQLKYKNIKNIYTGEVIKPRNLEQKMAMHLLQNQNIKVKLLTSAWGSGKTLLALNYALDQVARGTYKKLVFIRNNIIVSDTNDIGFLPGDVREKMSIWGGPIADHLGGDLMLQQLIDEDIIEIFPLSHIRGRSLRSVIAVVDECENLNDKLVTLLLSRIEEDSEIIFCGDVAQIDDRRFEKNNGIRAMIENLAGDPLFGTVKLIKSERGAVPRLADLIIPPK